MRILLVDDHPLIREGLVHVLREVYPDADVAEAEDAAGTLSAIHNSGPFELILLDLAVPDANGWGLLENIRSLAAETPVVVLSASDARPNVSAALDRGAMGFISKRSSTPVLVHALRLVLAGGIYVPPEALSNLPTRQSPGLDESRAILQALGLTDREIDVLASLVQGKPNKAICRDLKIAESTVKTHISSILRLLKASNRTQILFALSSLGIRLPVIEHKYRKLD